MPRSPAIALALCLVASPPNAIAAEAVSACPGSGWTVAQAAERERALICDGVASTTAMLAACGLEATAAEITVEATMPKVCDAPAHALYDSRTKGLRIASLSVCVSNAVENGLFDTVGPDAAYRSIAAHEAAHAILDANGLSSAQWIGNEYIAAAAQYSALSPEDRQALLDALETRGPVETGQITGVLYAMAPARFAARSWLHYADLEDPCGFIVDIISGRQRFVGAHF